MFQDLMQKARNNFIERFNENKIRYSRKDSIYREDVTATFKDREICVGTIISVDLFKRYEGFMENFSTKDISKDRDLRYLNLFIEYDKFILDNLDKINFNPEKAESDKEPVIFKENIYDFIKEEETNFIINNNILSKKDVEDMRCVNKPSLAFNSRDLNVFYEVYFKNELERMIEEGKLYKRGHQYRKYSENSKAALMRKMREKQGYKPRNISPDYRNQMYDLIYEKDKNGKKIRNSIIIYKLNEKKRDVLLYKLKYQTKIRHTTFIYFLQNGEKVTTKIFKKIETDIILEKIDLSKGIYVIQYRHCNIGRENIKYSEYSDSELYHNARRLMLRHKVSKIKFYTKSDNSIIEVSNLKSLKQYKEDIDWNKLVYWYECIPVNINNSRWNEEIGGYWLNLPKLCDEDKVSDFQLKHKVEKPLKSGITVKVSLERAHFVGDDESIKDFKDKFSYFSYEECNKVFGNNIKDFIKKTASAMRDVRVDKYGDIVEHIYKYIFADNYIGRYESNKDVQKNLFNKMIYYLISKIFIKLGMKDVLMKNENTKEIVEDINKLKNKRQFKQYDDEHSFVSFKDEEDLAIKAKNKTFDKYVKVIKDMNRPLDYLGYIKLLKARKFARCW